MTRKSRNAWGIAVSLMFMAAVIVWLVVAAPPMDEMLQDLQTCPAGEITEVRLYDFDAAYAGSRPSLTLTGAGATAFMEMISNAESTRANRPYGGSTIFVEIDTRKWGTKYLRISATDNCGVLIYLMSNKLGQSHWQSSPLRNDDLLNIFSDLNYARRASSQKRAVAAPTTASTLQSPP